MYNKRILQNHIIPKPTKVQTTIKLIVAMLLASCCAMAQLRDGNAYAFLNLPASARTAALGGQHATLAIADASSHFNNPALVTDTFNNAIAATVAPIATGILASRASYARHIERIGTVAIGFNHIGYGTMDMYDYDGNEQGTFGAHETAVSLIYSRALSPRWQLAATLKPIFSSFANYSSVAVAMDMGANYVAKNKRFTFGAVLSNVGAQLTTYHTDASRERLDTDLRLGISYKPEHAPFRLTLTFKDLLRWNLSTHKDRKLNFADNLMRHTIVGVELVPIRNFYLAFGYNQRIRRELRESDTGGLAGLSWGFGLRIARIDIAYGCAKYHQAGSDNVISISTDLRRFF